MGIIRLYWWSEVFIQKKQKENYGDLLGKYLVEKISGQPVRWVRANKFYIKNLWKPVYVTIGSVLEHVGAHCTIWGSGIITRKAQIANATFTAVRGPLSRKRILELGYRCPQVYGDPAILLPLYYQSNVEKENQLGIVPHISDLKLVKDLCRSQSDIKVIDFNTNDIEATTRALLSCKHIISSSLHGVIVAHAYGIPAMQVSFSDKISGDGVKYHDYYQSVELPVYNPDKITTIDNIEDWMLTIKNHQSSLPRKEVIFNLQQGLLKACPFKPVSHE